MSLAESEGGASRVAVWATLALLVLIWGTTWSVIRVGLEGIPPFTGVALRFALAAVLLWAVARWRALPPPSWRRAGRIWAVQFFFTFFLSYGITYWAEQWIPSGLAAVLFSTFPLFVAIFARLWLTDDRMGPRGLLGLAIGFGGVAAIFSEDFAALGGPMVLGASAVMLLSPIVAAVASVLVKKWGAGIHPIHLTVQPMAATGVAMGAVALAFESEREIVFDARSLAALGYLSVVGSAVTFTLYFWLLARMRATRLSLITYGIPVVAVAVGTIFLDEPLTARTLAGGALVLLGVALAR